jgi:hypothetical protein
MTSKQELLDYEKKYLWQSNRELVKGSIEYIPSKIMAQ